MKKKQVLILKETIYLQIVNQRNKKGKKMHKEGRDTDPSLLQRINLKANFVKELDVSIINRCSACYAP